MVTEWLLYDSQTNYIRLAEARTQKEAIRKGFEKGVVPRKTDDVRPRMIDHEDDKRLMSSSEFESFMGQFQ